MLLRRLTLRARVNFLRGWNLAVLSRIGVILVVSHMQCVYEAACFFFFLFGDGLALTEQHHYAYNTPSFDSCVIIYHHEIMRCLHIQHNTTTTTNKQVQYVHTHTYIRTHICVFNIGHSAFGSQRRATMAAQRHPPLPSPPTDRLEDKHVHVLPLVWNSKTSTSVRGEDEDYSRNCHINLVSEWRWCMMSSHLSNTCKRRTTISLSVLVFLSTSLMLCLQLSVQHRVEQNNTLSPTLTLTRTTQKPSPNQA